VVSEKGMFSAEHQRDGESVNEGHLEIAATRSHAALYAGISASRALRRHPSATEARLCDDGVGIKFQVLPGRIPHRRAPDNSMSTVAPFRWLSRPGGALVLEIDVRSS
jgi:hypothetical protein